MNKFLRTIQVCVIAGLIAFSISGCKSKQLITTQKTLEGDKVKVENYKVTGIDMAETLNEEGTGTTKMAFKWYLGEADVNDKQLAVETAQAEAYATISKVISNIVQTNVERGAIANNGKAQKAIKSYWQQNSQSIQKGAEPFGDVEVAYNAETKMYHVKAKVAIRGDKYNQFLKNASNFKPDDLQGDDLQQFIEVNQSIINSAKGQ